MNVDSPANIKVLYIEVRTAGETRPLTVRMLKEHPYQQLVHGSHKTMAGAKKKAIENGQSKSYPLVRENIAGRANGLERRGSAGQVSL